MVLPAWLRLGPLAEQVSPLERLLTAEEPQQAV
jgi:hypothetical protein